MRTFLLRRLLFALPTLVGVTFITFLLVRSVPGDPVLSLIGQRADPETIEALRRQLGLEKPLILQYGHYLRRLSLGQWGNSLYSQRPVSQLLMEKFPNTLRLALAAMVFAIFSGLLLGIGAAIRRGSSLDATLTFLATLGLSTPVFWLGLLLIMLFAIQLSWLPASGMGGGALAYLILPALTLGIRSASYVARVTRASMLEALSMPYTTTARAKGLGQFPVVMRHSLKNALCPIITMAGLDFGSYLNGAVLTETIFGWDGLGRLAFDAILKRDYPLIMGAVLFGSILFVLINILVDISYAFLDPRIRYER